MLLSLQTHRNVKYALLGRRVESLALLYGAGVQVPETLILPPDTAREGLEVALRSPIERISRQQKEAQSLFNVMLSPLVAQYETAFRVEDFVPSFEYVGWAGTVPEHMSQFYEDFQVQYAARVSAESPPPETTPAQIAKVVEALLAEWDSKRQRHLRQAHGLDPEMRVAVLIQHIPLQQFLSETWVGWMCTHDTVTGEQTRAFTPQEIAPDYLLTTLSYQAQSVLKDALSLHVVHTPELGVQVTDVYPLPRTGRAAVEITVDLAESGILSIEEALLNIAPNALEACLHATRLVQAEDVVIAQGVSASPGAIVGEVVFSANAADVVAARGGAPILIQPETGPDDLKALYASSGVITARGGLTSHAAVVARGIGKPCIVGVSDLQFDRVARTVHTASGHVLREGDQITLDGAGGQVILGAARVQPAALTGAFAKIMEWSDAFRDIYVYANADTAQDAQIATQFAADGIGLCRTEHMFLNGDSLSLMQGMLFAQDEVTRQSLLEQLEAYLTTAVVELFTVMQGRSVTVRLLDIPLHEFIPRQPEARAALAKQLNMTIPVLEQRLQALTEVNPMLGKRGCRLGLLYPEIYNSQVHAIFKAMQQVAPEITVRPEIMIPLVSSPCEVKILSARIKSIAGHYNYVGAYAFGVMIETPRAALCAGKMASWVDFISFGTNDLTQMVFGLSRDDVGQFMEDYLKLGVWESDPFRVLDIKGVGILIQSAIQQIQAERDGMRIGLCGEHGADPQSIEFCMDNGLDYVSCSPYRIPIARLAAAQVTIKR